MASALLIALKFELGSTMKSIGLYEELDKVVDVGVNSMKSI
jgi:hypothetical protein